MNDKQNQFNAEQQDYQTDSSQAINTLKDKELSPSLPKGRRSRRKKKRFKALVSPVYLSTRVEERSHLLMRLLGYGLLVFALIDYIDVVIPPHFTDPSWEFQTLGGLVEHSVVPLVGLMLVFYRHQGYVIKLEKNFLGFLSWVSLLVGLVYLLVVPLGVADTWRIYHTIEAQVAAQISQQSQQLQQIKGQLNQATTDEQVKQLVASLSPSGRSPDKNPQASKDQLLAKISQAEQSIKIQAEKLGINQKQALIKNSLKWHLGSLVSGNLFILIWSLTYWARTAKSLK